MTLPARRGAIVALTVAVVGGMLAVDATVGRVATKRLTAAPLVSATEVVPAGQGTSSWFCTGGSGAGASAEATVVMVNPTDEVVRGTFSAVSSSGAHRTLPVTIAAGGMTTIVPAQAVAGPWLAASVDLNRGGVGVDETVASPLGWSEAPCASSTARSWYFADGSTAGSNGVALSIYNPGAAEAVVDTELVTSKQKVLKPAAYQGVDIPAGSLVTEYISDHDESDPGFAASVTAVSGSVVAAELQSYQAAGADGIAVMLGAPAPATVWAFPSTEQIGGGHVAFHLYDPGRQPAHVTMVARSSRGATAPIALTVPAHGTLALDAAHQASLPLGIPFSVRFVSTNRVGVVVSRVSIAAPRGGSPQEGMTPGTIAGVDQWVLPAITPPGTTPWSFTVQDLAASPVSVTVTRVNPAPGSGSASVTSFTVSPSAPKVFGGVSPAPVGLVPTELRASGPVAVELDPEPVGAPGVVVVPALPLG